MSIMVKIQAELHAPKNQENKFGKYKYRSCEDIVEAVKPVLAKYDCWLNISDEIVMLGDRFYVRATATVYKGSEPQPTSVASASAYAREAFEQKGMQESQLTGATSSYARKYALNGLFAIDDTKDADSQDNSNYKASKGAGLTADQTIEMTDLLKQSEANEAEFFKYFKCTSFGDMPATVYHKAKGMLEKKIYDQTGEK